MTLLSSNYYTSLDLFHSLAERPDFEIQLVVAVDLIALDYFKHFGRLPLLDSHVAQDCGHITQPCPERREPGAELRQARCYLPARFGLLVPDL
jgi:hypothetical protein